MPEDSTSEPSAKRRRVEPTYEAESDSETPSLLETDLPLSLQPEPMRFFNQHRRELAAKKREQRWFQTAWARPTLPSIDENTDRIGTASASSR